MSEHPITTASAATLYAAREQIARLREELAEVTALNARLSGDNDTLRNTLERERHECPGCEQYGHELADMTAERDALLRRGESRPATEEDTQRLDWLDERVRLGGVPFVTYDVVSGEQLWVA